MSEDTPTIIIAGKDYTALSIKELVEVSNLLCDHFNEPHINYGAPVEAKREELTQSTLHSLNKINMFVARENGKLVLVPQSQTKVDPMCAANITRMKAGEDTPIQISDGAAAGTLAEKVGPTRKRKRMSVRSQKIGAKAAMKKAKVESTPVKPKKKTKAKVEPKGAKTKRFSPEEMSKKIVVVGENPHREGSSAWQNFELCRDATVAQYLQNGGDTGYLKDGYLGKGLVKLEG